MIKAIIKILNNPRLSRLNGSEIIEIIGFSILKPTARSIPPKKRVSHPLWSMSPEKINLVT